jgi:iron-sulfur cluster insertion protein
MSPDFAITDTAAARIAYLLLKEEKGAGLRLRIAVNGGGCSGFQYSFLFDDAQTQDDQVFEHQGVGVIIDTISLELLKGSTLDYVEDLAAAMFVIKNPNAASGCGCGNSFSV